MADINQKISTTVTFDTSQAQAKAKELEKVVDRLSGKAATIGGGGSGSGGGTPSGTGGGRSSSSSILSPIGSLNIGAMLSGIGSMMGPVGMIAGTLWSAASSFVSAIWDGLKFAGELAVGLGKTLLIGAGAFAASLAAGIYAAHKLLSPAAEAERYRAQLSVFGKSDKIEEYKKVATEGPQDLGQVVRAGISLESYGLDSSKYMKVVQDAASTFGRDMTEVAGILSRAKSGTIEIDQMNMVGLTKADLMTQGVKYEKGGGIADESRVGLEDKVAAAMNSKYAGMALSMSKTYEGAISNLLDSIKTGIENTFKGVLPYATAFVLGITEAVSKIGDGMAKLDWTGAGEQLVSLWENAAGIINSIDWAGIGQTFVGMAEKSIALAGSLFSAEGLTNLGDTLLSVLDTAWQGLKLAVAESIVWAGNMLNAAFLWITSPSLWQSILYGAFQIGVAVLEQALVNQFRSLYTMLTSVINYIGTTSQFFLAGLEAMMAKLNPFGDLGVGTAFRDKIGKNSFVDMLGINQSILDDKILKHVNPYKYETGLEKKARELKEGILPQGDGNGVGNALEQTFSSVMQQLNNFVTSSVANGKNPEATAKIENEKAERERLNAVKAAKAEQDRIASILKANNDAAEATRASNSIQSQILQEMRHMNEYNMSDIAAAMMW